MTGLPFPAAAPEALGIPSGALLRLVDAMDRLDQAHSFVLLRHGRIAARGGWTPYSPELPHELFSLSKSFVSLAIGFARRENLLALEDRVVKFFPEYLSDAVSPAMRRVTLRDLLTMRSGHDRCSFGFVDFAAGDWVKEILESPLAYEPGSVFVYNSGATHLLAAVIHRVTGVNVAEYLQERLFTPLGIAAPEWNNSPQGINIGGWGLWLSTDDLARFGQMLLQGGVWQGRALVDAGYLHEATSFQADNSANDLPDWRVGYGYQFWRCQHNAYRCDGAGGQFVLVMPDQDMVLAFNSGIGNMQRLLSAVWEELLPALSDDPLPEDPAAYAQLSGRLAGLAAAMPDALRCGGAAAAFAGRRDYTLARNPWGFRELILDAAADSVALSLDGVEIRAGVGSWSQCDAALAAKTPHRVAARAAWCENGALVIYALCLQTTARFTFTLTFEGDSLTLKRTTPIFFYSDQGNVILNGRRSLHFFAKKTCF